MYSTYSMYIYIIVSLVVPSMTFGVDSGNRVMKSPA